MSMKMNIVEICDLIVLKTIKAHITRDRRMFLKINVLHFNFNLPTNAPTRSIS